MLTLHQLGRLRLRMLPRSVARQCLNHVDREGSWHTHTVAPVTVDATPLADGGHARSSSSSLTLWVGEGATGLWPVVTGAMFVLLLLVFLWRRVDHYDTPNRLQSYRPRGWGSSDS